MEQRRMEAVAEARKNEGKAKKDMTSESLVETRTGMRAAGSGVGGHGLNTVPSTTRRRDGQEQAAVIADLEQQVADLMELKENNPDDPVFKAPNSETLSKFQVVCNRHADLENWLGREDAPEEMAKDKDSSGVIRLRYDGELRDTVPEEGGGEGIFVRHGHATVRMGDGVFFEGFSPCYQRPSQHSSCSLAFPPSAHVQIGYAVSPTRTHAHARALARTFTLTRPCTQMRAQGFSKTAHRRARVSWFSPVPTNGRVLSIVVACMATVRPPCQLGGMCWSICARVSTACGRGGGGQTRKT